MTYILYQEVEKQTLANHEKQQKIFLTQLSVSIENYFSELFKSLDYFSKKENIIVINDETKIEFKYFYEAHLNELNAITRVSEDGKLLYTYPFVESVINSDISVQPHNKEIIKTHKLVISEIFTSVQGYKTIAVAYPIFKDDNYKGSISLLLKFDKMVSNFINPIVGLKDFTGIILSEEGKEIYFTEKNNFTENESVNLNKKFLENNLPKLLSGNINKLNKSFSSSENNDIEKQIVYSKVNLGNTYWIVGAVLNVSDILEVNRGFITKLAAIFISTLLFISILGYLYFSSESKNAKLLKQKEEEYKNDLVKTVEERTEELKSLNKSLEDDLKYRKHIEKQLISAIDKAEKSEKIKSNFLAQMSHEIRTPINTILSFSNLIKEKLIDKVSEELKYGFSGINRASRRLIRTIDLILNMSDVQAGTHEYLPSKFDISFIIKKILDDYKDQISEKKLKIIFNNFTQNTELIADIYSVEQIFSNLIDNAVKYTNEGSIKIDVNKDENKFLKISITDSGVGISDEYLHKIFNEFTQEDMGYTRKFEGNGLGLALVKKYCEFNNALITVKSEKGIGSTFTVTFMNVELYKKLEI
ncbi:MAG: sensor histidine kinase [Ignavibacteriae bacterium]|nr:sensor histidine kinase [Ignavibacteriota bacterium]